MPDLMQVDPNAPPQQQQTPQQQPPAQKSPAKQPQTQQPQTQQPPAHSTPSQPPGPLDPNKAPTPAQLTREEKRKRKRDGVDDDSDRASEVRALVLRTDNRHLRMSIVPFEDRPNAVTHTDFHVRFWKGEVAPAVVTMLPKWDVQPRGITLEDALVFNKSAKPWLSTLREAAAAPDSANGYACVVQVMDRVIKQKELGKTREHIQDALIRVCHLPSITVIAPQPSDDARDGHPHFSAYSYLVQHISLEAVHTLCAHYAFHVSWAENNEGISFNVLPPDLPPPTHVGSYEEMQNLPRLTTQLEARILQKCRENVARHYNEAADFLRRNKASVWTGANVEKWWLELLQASTRIRVWETIGRDKQTEVTLSVYFLGVFDAPWLHSVWEDTLMGPELDLGELGTYKRKPSHKKNRCGICRDRDHHARICPIWTHAMWPETIRQRREDRIKAAGEREGSEMPSGSSAQRGSSTPRGRGRGAPRGGHYYGPAPPGYYYDPGYYLARGYARGAARGAGRGRGGHE